MHDQEFHLQPSKIGQYLMLGISIASIVIVLNLSMAIYWKCLGVVLVGLYASIIFWKKFLLKSTHSILSLRCTIDGQWQIQTANGEAKIEILRESTVTPWVTILCLKMKNKFFPLSCIIFRDSLAKDYYRKLVVALKLTT